MIRTSFAVSTFLFAPLALMAASLAAAPENDSVAATATLLPVSGFDFTGMDLREQPGDDFYGYAIGRWRERNEIPADRSQWGTFDQLDHNAQMQVREIVESLPADAPAGSIEQKVRDYYLAYLDTKAIENAGLAPLKATLQAIDGARGHADLAALMGKAELELPQLIAVRIQADEKKPDRYIVKLSQGGLGLPDREYYLRQNEAFRDVLDKYQTYIVRILTLLGEANAEAKARMVVDLERAMAQRHWPTAQRYDRDLTYNLHSRKQLEALAPYYPWAPFLAAAGVQSEPQFVVAERDAIEKLARLYAETPLAAWRSYLKFHYVDAHADLLAGAVDEANFEFRGRTLRGQQRQRERWQRAVEAVNDALGESVGQLYVRNHYSRESERQLVAMLDNLRKAYAERIRRSTWMGEQTRLAALEKLFSIRLKLGHPKVWRDYGKLDVRPSDAFGNAVRARSFERARLIGRLHRPTDRDEWNMTPQTVNAYYNATFNEVVVPAAIVQAPFFDPAADPAVNYGALGAVVGHEFGHAFDDQGAKSDGNGVLRTWWRKEDELAFARLGDALVAQYDEYEPLPGLKMNGRLTLGENIADLGGLEVAHEAYRVSLAGKAAAVLDGFTGEQRLFLSYAQVWRTRISDASLRVQVLGNSHGPSQFRVNGVVRNIDAWYTAFGIRPTDALFLPANQRVRIW